MQERINPQRDGSMYVTNIKLMVNPILVTDTGISDLIAADCCMASNSPITGIVGTGANFRIYCRPGFNCVVKQLRFWLFKVDCEFKDCDLRVLRIGHTCVIAF